MNLSGIGPATASAIVATVGKGRDFSGRRQFCAWLGLVPGSYSWAGKQRRRESPKRETAIVTGHSGQTRKSVTIDQNQCSR
ncbi:MAG: transposase [Polaromonas sp.]